LLIAQKLPPWQIRQRGQVRSTLRHAKPIIHIGLWPLVIRAHGAGSQESTEYQQRHATGGQERPHQWSPSTEVPAYSRRARSGGTSGNSARFFMGAHRSPIFRTVTKNN